MMNNSLMRRHAVVISILRITAFYIYFSLIYNLTTFFSRLLLITVHEPAAKSVSKFYCCWTHVSLPQDLSSAFISYYGLSAYWKTRPQAYNGWLLLSAYCKIIRKSWSWWLNFISIYCKHWQKCLQSAANTGRSV